MKASLILRVSDRSGEILGGEGGLDHVVGNFFERHRIVAQQPALADFVAVAIEEGDAILVGEVDLALRDLEGR